MMVVLKITFILYVFLINFTHSITTRKGLKVKYTISSFKNCLQSDNILTMITQVSLSQCVDECAFRTNCRAVNYFNRYHLCKLLLNDDGITFQISNKAYPCAFVKKADIEISEIDEKCLCGNGETCNIELNFSCSSKDCESLTIQNGQVRGNMRSIGDSIKYDCDQMYVATFQTSEATCQQNGTWSYQPECKTGGNILCSGCVLPRDCEDVKLVNKMADTGVYEIYPTGGDAFNVRCDMETPPRGWTVFQHRESNSDFEKNWQVYKEGFGNLDSNFWLGNDKIWKLTSSSKYKLRVDLRDQNGVEGYAEYNSFSIGNDSTNYILNIAGHSGTATDSLIVKHNGMMFTTFDQRHDMSRNHRCVHIFKGGWWYNNCQTSNLNGPYGNVRCNRGMTWKTWSDPCVFMRFTEMNIRR